MMARTQDTNRGIKMTCDLGVAPVAPIQEIREIPALSVLALRRNAASHPRLTEFRSWMQETKAGTRQCPRGGFPDNFLFWLDGGRW